MSLQARAPRFHSRAAFTLIELLTVIAIIGVLASIVMTSVTRLRASARRTACSSNLRQIGMAFQLYAGENRGLYPSPRQPDAADKVAADSSNPSGAKVYPTWANQSGGNWAVEISRYIYRDQADINAVKDASGGSNIAHCPAYDQLFNADAKLTAQSNISTAGYGMNYQLNVSGVVAGATPKVRFKASAIGSPSKSVLVGDSSEFFINAYAGWTTSAAYPDGYNNGAPTRHDGSANYLYADGRVASLSPTAALSAVKSIP